MEARPRPTFGKRNPATRPRSASGAEAVSSLPVEDPHRAFFAALFSEHGNVGSLDTGAPAPSVVPRSLRAAVLAGLVVACGLAGLDATTRLAAMRDVAAVLPDQPGVPLLAPALILLAVIGGGRAAATSLLVAHWGLARLGETGHLAYALGGAAAAGAVAALLLVLLGQPPAHGFALDVLAGGAGGFFYRVFAGTRASEPARHP